MAWIHLPELVILGNVLLAMALGGVIGWEREVADKPAGFRTHMLVAGAAALFVIIGDILVDLQINETGTIRTDPIRIVEAVITGVSFLGAGTIIQLRNRDQVQGLTTGASLLFVAAVGISVAISQYVLAFGATVLVLLVLLGGRLVERHNK